MSPSKSSLRKLIGESLKSLGEKDKRVQSESVANKLWRHPSYKAARGVSLYLSTTNEIDTLPILRRALELDQKRCFIPFIRHQDNAPKSTAAAAAAAPKTESRRPPRMSMVEITSMGQYEALPVNRYGIKEPHEDSGHLVEAKPGDMELVLVPGVAFSSDGRRLGHGKGYYDEFLAYWSTAARANGHPFSTIGLAFREQVVGAALVVQDEHDYILDELLVA